MSQLLFSADALDPRSKPIDWNSQFIQTTQQSNNQLIALIEGATLSAPSIIQTKIDLSKTNSIILSYQVVYFGDEATRGILNITPIWTIPKDVYDKIRRDGNIYILHKDDVILNSKEIDEIKNHKKFIYKKRV